MTDLLDQARQELDLLDQARAEIIPEGAPMDVQTGLVGPSQRGGAEASAAMLTGMIAEPIAGWAGIIGSLWPGEEGQGARAVEYTRDLLTYQPKRS